MIRRINKVIKLFDSYTLVFLVISVFAFSLIYSTLSIVRHNHFESGGFDLGIYDQAIWQYSRFHYPFNSIKMKMILGDHLTLTLPLLAPLYWLYNDVRLLLLFQAIWIALSQIPLYLYCRKRGFSNLESFLLSILYITFYGIQYGIFFDFHPVLIGVGLLPWIIYFWEKNRTLPLAITIAMLLATQENMGIALFGLCLIWLFERKKQKTVIALIIISILSVFISFKVSSYFAQGQNEYIPSFPSSVTEYTSRLFDTQEKQKVWLYTESWYSFLPLFSPGSVLAVVSDLSQYFVTGDAYSRMWSPFTHHRAILSVFAIMGTIVVLTNLKIRKIPAIYIILFLVVSALLQQYIFHFPINKLAKRSFWEEQEWMRDNQDILSKIPLNASVAAQQSLVPHLSHRDNVYLIYPHEKSNDQSLPCASCWWLDFGGNPDYLVVDVHPGVWLTMTLAEEDNFKQALSNMESKNMIRLVDKQNDAKLYVINKNVPDYAFE